MATSAFIQYGSFSFSGVSGYPVPSIGISRDQQRDGAGRPIGALVSISLEGKIYTGSGNTGFNHLLALESGLRNAFSSDGQTLTIGCGSTTTIYSGIKINKYSASRTDDNWTTTIDYSIELQSEVMNTGSGIFYVNSTQDDWSIETLEENSFAKSPLNAVLLGYGGNIEFGVGSNYPFYRISRTLGAVGKFVPTGTGGMVSGDSPVKNAKDWVNYQLNNSVKYSGMISGLVLYNFVRSISSSDTEGSYKITDNWLGVPSGTGLKPYTETFTVESTLDTSMLRTVTINGTVKGLEPFNSGNIYNVNSAPYLSGSLSGSIADLYNNNALKFNNNTNTKFYYAVSGYSGIKMAMYNRAAGFAYNVRNTPTTTTPAPLTTASTGGFNFTNAFSTFNPAATRYEANLNPIPVTITEGMNPSEGTITYSWSFNNRPLNLIAGSISETLSVEDGFALPLVASIFVLGRKLGPILQDLGTISASNRNVTFEVVLPRPTGLRNLTFPIEHYKAITGIVESFNPTNLTNNPDAGGVRAYVKADQSNWNVSEGRFTKIKSWEWVKCITDPQ